MFTHAFLHRVFRTRSWNFLFTQCLTRHAFLSRAVSEVRKMRHHKIAQLYRRRHFLTPGFIAVGLRQREFSVMGFEDNLERRGRATTQVTSGSVIVPLFQPIPSRQRRSAPVMLLIILLYTSQSSSVGEMGSS